MSNSADLSSLLPHCLVDSHCFTRQSTLLSSSLLSNEEVKKLFPSHSSSSSSICLLVTSLPDTIFYAEGGGQPSDIGTINNFEVIHIEWDVKNSSAKHFISLPSPSASPSIPSDLSNGQMITMNVSPSYRLDSMQSHSSQHLISAITATLSEFMTVSWWFTQMKDRKVEGKEKEKEKKDEKDNDNENHEGEGSIFQNSHFILVKKEISSSSLSPSSFSFSPSVIHRIESHCNDVIRRNAQMKTFLFDDKSKCQQFLNEQKSQFPNIHAKSLPGSGSESSEKSGEASEDSSDGLLSGLPLRVVTIEGVDVNFCGGTHVSSLSELQFIKIFHVEKVENVKEKSKTKGKGKESNSTSSSSSASPPPPSSECYKIYFQSGIRCLSTLGFYNSISRTLTSALSCGPTEYVSTVQRIQNDHLNQIKSEKRFILHMGKLHSQIIRQRIAAEKEEEKDISFRFHHHSFPSLLCFSASNVGEILTALTQQLESEFISPSPPSSSPIIFLFSATVNSIPLSATAETEGTTGNFVLFTPSAKWLTTEGNAKIFQSIGAAVCESVGGKGGGKGNKFNGKGEKVSEGNIQKGIQKVLESQLWKVKMSTTKGE